MSVNRTVLESLGRLSCPRPRHLCRADASHVVAALREVAARGRCARSLRAAACSWSARSGATNVSATGHAPAHRLGEQPDPPLDVQAPQHAPKCARRPVQSTFTATPQATLRRPTTPAFWPFCSTTRSPCLVSRSLGARLAKEDGAVHAARAVANAHVVWGSQKVQR